MKTYLLRTTALSSCALLLAACQSVPPCTSWKDQQSSETLRSLRVLDAHLHDRIGFSASRTHLSPDLPASVEIEVYNCTGQDVVLGFKTQFRTSGGSSGDATTWKKVYLPPNGTGTYVERAVGTGSQAAIVEVIDANRPQSGPVPGALR